MANSLQARIFRALLGVAFVTLLVGIVAAISLHFLSQKIDRISTSTWPATDAVLELNLALHKSNFGLERFIDGDLDQAKAIIGNARERTERELNRLATTDVVATGTLQEIQELVDRTVTEQDRLIGLREIDELTARQLVRSWENVGHLFAPLTQQLADDRGVSADLLSSMVELHHLLSLTNTDHAEPVTARVVGLIDWIQALPSYSHYREEVAPYLVAAERHATLSLEHGDNAHQMATLRTSIDMLTTQLDRRLARIEAQMRKEMLDTSTSALTQTANTQTMLLLAIVLATALAIIFSRYLSRAIGQPLQRFGEAVSAFGRDRSFRVDLRTGDELQTLAETFNTMAASLDSTTVTRDYFDDIITSMLDCLFVVSSDGKILLANLAARQLTGLEQEEIEGQSFVELLTPKAHQRWIDSGHTRLAAGELELIGSKDTPVPVLFSRARMGGDQGERGNSVVVLRDIRRRKEEEATLRQAKEEAVLGERTKSEFLANISHEIRTPLNGVIGMLQLLLESHQDREQREYTQVAHQSAEMLLRLLNDLLDLTRLNAGKMPIDKTPFSVAPVVEEVIDLFTPEASAKGLELACHVASSVPLQTTGDPARLRQVLINLVGNAIKFTQEGEVSVTSRSGVSGGVDFLVRDTGIGIDPEIGDRLFEIFRQADGSPSRRFGGSGLGLTIVRQLCSLMGGRVSYRSRPGEGSLFTVNLPLAGIATDAVSATSPALHGRRLLLADGSAVVRAAFGDLLADSGAEIRCHESVGEALQQVAAQDESPDLLLLDAKLLAATDLATRQRLISLWREADLPLVLLAMQGQPTDPVLGDLAGVPRLDKPLRGRLLPNALLRAMQKTAEEVSQSA